jgi:hypothetical protein
MLKVMKKQFKNGVRTLKKDGPFVSKGDEFIEIDVEETRQATKTY